MNRSNIGLLEVKRLRQAGEWVQRLNESFGDESVVEAWSLGVRTTAKLSSI